MDRWLRLPATLLPLLLTVACGTTDGTAQVPASPGGTGGRDSGPSLPPDPSPSPTATATARATPMVPAAASGTYLAVGDSLGVGVGATDPERQGYVGRIHTALRNPVLHNLSVSGETSESFRLGGQLSRALEVIAAADPAVSLVTLDIGGNDLLALLRGEPCASQPNSVACRRAVALTLLEFEGSYRGALGQLRAALDTSAPDATLAVMTYFNPFSGTDAAYEAGGRLALLGTDLDVDCDAAADDVDRRGMNDIIACVGQDLGAEVVDVHPRFEGLGLELTHVGAEDIHANDRGYQVIADGFLEVLRVER